MATTADPGRPATAIYLASGLSKHYGGVRALIDADLQLRAGEVHALLGANGAGKSTLVKILAGAESPTVGTLSLRGEPVSFTNPEEAAGAGVALVSQELNLFPDLSALHNLFLRREPLIGGIVVSRAKMRRLAKTATDQVGLDVDLDRRVADLRLGERQLLEIARALLGKPSILILDEPTSALQAGETARLLEVVKTLRDSGVAVVFVSHFLEDVFRIADTVTILRGGRVVVEDRPASQISVAGAIKEMLGDAGFQQARLTRSGGDAMLAARAGGPEAPRGADALGAADDDALHVEGVSIGERVRNVSFSARVGEVVGLAGLEGSGAQAVMRLVFGQGHASSGRIVLPGGRKGPRSMAAAVRAGVALVPADRKAVGLMLTKSVAENVTLVNGGPLKRMGIVLGKRRMAERAAYWQERLGIKMSSPRVAADSLSGGNQQKVVFAKWLETEPKVVLLDDPTRGVDVGAKVEMQKLMRSAAEGRVVLYSSNDFEEMAEVCDRVLIFFGGEVRAEARSGLSEPALLEAVNTGTAAPS